MSFLRRILNRDRAIFQFLHRIPRRSEAYYHKPEAVQLSIPSPDSTIRFLFEPTAIPTPFNSFTGFHVAANIRVVTVGKWTFNSFTGFHKEITRYSWKPYVVFQFLHRIPPKPYTIQLWLYLTISSESLRLLSNSGFLRRFSGKSPFRTLSVPQNLYIGVPGETFIFCSSKQGSTPHHPPTQARRKPAPRAPSSEATCQASPPATLLSSCATREISDRGTRRSPC